jgi:Uma2 family endonuclease
LHPKESTTVQNPVRTKLEYRDLLATPDDGKRYELIDGDLFVTPAPSPQHQRIVVRLYSSLAEYCRLRGSGEVFVAPLDVILAKRDVVEPDLIVVGDPRQVSKRGIEGPPKLAVEVLSPTTRSVDRTVKASRYARFGIPHYWIVDPKASRVECLRLRDEVYELVVSAERGETLVHPDWPGLSIDLGALLRDT